MAIYHMPPSQTKYLKLSAEETQSIDDSVSIADKINTLVSILEIPSEQLEVRRKECAELRELLRKYYPDCMLLTFGSTINGFGLKYSDLDLLFLPFPGYCNMDYVIKEGSPKPSFPDSADIDSGKKSKDLLTKLDEFSHLLFIKSILKKEKKLISRLYIIPSKHSPTMKAYFAKSKLICDLAASNRLVVYNSELLEFYGKFDPRVKPLAISLRYWADSLGLMRKNFFSCYAFTLMIIFFLQNTDPPILPSAQRLMEKAGYSRMIAGWQTAITDVPPPKSKNKDSLEDLFLNFFQFYWNFDFAQHVISVYTGKVLPLKELKSDPDKKMADFLIASVNVQDPFVLNRNCCRKEGSFAILKLSLFIAHQMLQDKTGKFKFHMLFDPNMYNKLFKLHFDHFIFGQAKSFLISLDYDLMNYLKLNTQDPQLSLKWYQQVCQSVFDILQYGLLMDCEVVDQSTGGIQNLGIKMEIDDAPIIDLFDVSGIKGSPFDLQLLISLQCYVFARVWVGRKQITDVKTETDDEFEDFSHPVLKSEYHLSKALIKSNPMINSPQPLLCFRCECYKHPSPQIADVVVVLKPLVASKEFLTVLPFLAAYINRTVKKMMFSA